MYERTSERFRTVLGHIMAALPDAPLEQPMVDLWFDYQIWRRRDLFCNGVVALCGEWPEKSTRIAGNFAEVVRVQGLQTLPDIPSAIFARCNIRDQPRLIRDLVLPYLFHFRLSRTPPPLVLMGEHRGPPVPATGVSLLEFSKTGNPDDWLLARITPPIGDMLRVTGLQVSGPEDDLEAKVPGYVLFAADIAMRYLF